MRNRKERKAMARRQYFKAAYYKAHHDIRLARAELRYAEDGLRILILARKDIIAWMTSAKD